MARIKFGMMMTDARGKLGGHVFSKNRGGAYIRTKVTPANPRTQDQQANRSLLGALSQGWSALSDAQRASWNGAVSSWISTNIFGDTVTPSGKSLYVKLNKNILSIGGTALLVAPEKVEMAILGFDDASIKKTLQEIKLDIAGVVTGFVAVVSATAPLSQGTSNVKGKFRRIYFDAADAVDADLLFGAYVSKFGIPALGANIHFEVKLIAANGQMSVPETIKATIVA